jgi:hypothetical protein
MQPTHGSLHVAALFNTSRRQIGSIRPSKSGAVAAFTGKRRLGLFVNESMAVAAIMDLADKPLEETPWCEWVEALLVEEGE